MLEVAEGGSEAPQKQPTTTRSEARARADSRTEKKSEMACTDDEDAAAPQSPGGQIPRSRSKQRRSKKDCALPGAVAPGVSFSNSLEVEVNLGGWNVEVENAFMLQGLSFVPIRLVITEDVIALGGGGYFSDKIPLCEVDAYQAVTDENVCNLSKCSLSSRSGKCCDNTEVHI